MDDNSDLLNGLLQHVRPMLNRLRYDIHIQSSILEDTQENYGELLGLCQSALWCISHKYSLKEVNLNEVSYIATYYQAMLEEKRMGKRILVVSNSGFGTTQLLVTKLRQHFPLYEIADVVSMIQLEKWTDLDKIDFLVSTMPLENMPVPCFLVSAVMSDADIRNIQDTMSASWMEEQFSLEHLEAQYRKGKLELHTVECMDSLRGIHSPYREKDFPGGIAWKRLSGSIRKAEPAFTGRKRRRICGTWWPTPVPTTICWSSFPKATRCSAVQKGAGLQSGVTGRKTCRRFLTISSIQRRKEDRELPGQSRFFLHLFQSMVPPEQSTTAPMICRERGEQRKAAIWPMSSGRAQPIRSSFSFALHWGEPGSW